MVNVEKYRADLAKVKELIVSPFRNEIPPEIFLGRMRPEDRENFEALLGRLNKSKADDLKPAGSLIAVGKGVRQPITEPGFLQAFNLKALAQGGVSVNDVNARLRKAIEDTNLFEEAMRVEIPNRDDADGTQKTPRFILRRGKSAVIIIDGASVFDSTEDVELQLRRNFIVGERFSKLANIYLPRQEFR